MEVPSSPLSSPQGSFHDSAPSSPSSPLSTLSKTPSLPDSPISHLEASKRYPSPMSTIASGVQSPVRLPTNVVSLGQPIYDNDSPESVEDGAPPAKKRKIYKPKERRTEYLDLTKPDTEITTEDSRQMERLAAALRKKKKIVVIAGAGISVSAGIPDFRSSTGLFARARTQHNIKGSGKHLFDASVYKHDSSTQSFHTMVREMEEMTKNAQPTPFHHLLASLGQEGRLLRLYSQNIDCVDTNMKPLATEVPLPPKGPWPTTVQLHGGLQKMVCTKCGYLEPFNGKIFDGPEAPLCESCKVDDQVRTAHAGKRSHGIGRLRPRFVLYNEYNPDEEAIGNVSSADLKSRPDCVIVVGTTLKVPGTRRLVREMCQVARGRRDGLTIWINIDAEPKGVEFKDCWDLVVKSKCDDVARLVALPPWDCDIGDDYLVSKEQDSESLERLKRTTIEIPLSVSPTRAEYNLHVKPKLPALGSGNIPTPRPSPKPSKKQTKLLFGNKSEGEKQSAKTTKPRAQKPKQPAKPKAPPKNTVLQTFKAAKNISGGKDIKKLDGPVEFSAKRSREELPSLSLLEPKLQIVEVEYASNMVSSDGLGELDSTAPSTPTASTHKAPRETISPKSVPHNMRALIDMA